MINRAVRAFFTLMMLCLALFIALLSSQVQAALQVSQCNQTITMRDSHWQVYKDHRAVQTFTEVQGLAEDVWQPADRSAFAPGFTRAAYWYRTTIDNQAQAPCRYWLDLDSQRVTDMQMYTQQAGSAWQAERAGVAYPVQQWSSAQLNPALPVVLAPASTTHIVLRLSSAHTFAVDPQLLPQHALIKSRMTQTMFDGMTFGVLCLLIILSLFVGYFYQLQVLLVLAVAVLAYAAYTVLLAGYGFVYLWPQSVQLNAYMVMIVEAITRVCMLAYLRVLLQVKKQPACVGRLFTAIQISLIVWLLLRLVFVHEPLLDAGSAVSYGMRLAILATVLYALYMGVRCKLSYEWFSYAVPVLVLSQTVLLILFSWGFNVVKPFEHVWLSLSILPGALLLAYTLVTQIALGRQREESALIDIEQLKRAEQDDLEQRVELRTQQLRNALSNQNMLLARISHDLRSPLQHVIRDARLLESSSTQLAHYGQSIQRTAQQQLDLIDELLEFSRGELKQLELLVAPGYLFGFLREIEETGMFLAERNHNTFTSELANDLPLLVNADFRRLRQVIINLLANSAKFTQKGHIKLAVKLLSLDKQAGHADMRFIVTDNGIGIPHKERQNLLQPFQRGESSTGYEGMGLGLYIVRQLLDSMSSQLEIGESSNGGVRCHFIVRLELASEHELEQVFIESYAASSEGEQHTVLIVDDVAITQEMLYELLSGYNYNPITCSSAAEALVILRDNPVDIIITDQVMPVMDGWDLLRCVRNEWPDLPVLLYSARPSVRPLDLHASIDFDACLLKPATTSELLAQISRLLS